MTSTEVPIGTWRSIPTGTWGQGWWVEDTNHHPLQAATGPQASPAREPAVRRSAPSRLGRRGGWLRRRWMLVLLGLVAGTLGGFAASHGRAPSYTATAKLVVPSGASRISPGSANDAQALAITYAALLPEDQAVVDQVAADIGMSPTAVARNLFVQAESGTALLDVRFTAPVPEQAVAGANAVAINISGASPPTRAIAKGSVTVVSEATSATRSGGIYRFGALLGAILGLLVGLVAALVAERADRRVDDVVALGEVAGTRATAVWGGLSPVELATALAAEPGTPAVSVVPMRPAQRAAAGALAESLARAWPGVPGDGPVRVTDPFVVAPEAAAIGQGRPLLVVGQGERVVAVRDVVDRLRLVGRPPAWSALAPAPSAQWLRRPGRWLRSVGTGLFGGILPDPRSADVHGG
ncbi:MAG TPA: hypothetical protein VHB02_12740 [Acidimicrobiales bacterium]|nr:hypothetical protein [Acidimicrobiales bacterium]